MNQSCYYKILQTIVLTPEKQEFLWVKLLIKNPLFYFEEKQVIILKDF